MAGQGLWGNDPGSDQWFKLGTGSSPAQIQNRPASLIFDPEEPDRFWESGHYSGAGAFRTTDGGRTFQALGSVIHLDGLSVDLSDPSRQTLLAGAHERAELFRSTDGGATWTNLASQLPPGTGAASQPLVLDSQRYLLGTTGGDGTGIFRSTDAGQSWHRVASTGVAGPPLVASDGAIYWLLGSPGGLIRSTDDGETWTLVTGSGLVASHNLVEIGDGRLAAVGPTHLIISDDRGATWRGIGPRIPTNGAYGLTYSDSRSAVYIWQWDCTDKVPPGSVQRLDLPRAAG